MKAVKSNFGSYLRLMWKYKIDKNSYAHRVYPWIASIKRYTNTTKSLHPLRLETFELTFSNFSLVENFGNNGVKTDFS